MREFRRRSRAPREGIREVRSSTGTRRARTACCPTCRWPTSSSARGSRPVAGRWQHARLLRRVARHVLAGSAARAADALHLGAAAVAQVPAGRLRQDAARQARPLSRASRSFGRIVGRKVLTGLGLDQVRAGRQWVGADPRRPDHLVSPARPEPVRGLCDVRGQLLFALVTIDKFNEAGYVGVPMPGVEARISAEGEILIKSPGQIQRLLQAAGADRRDRSRRTASSAPATWANDGRTAC